MTATSSEPGEVRDGDMTLFEHLGELRDRLVKAVVALVAGAIVGYLVFEPVLDFLIRPYCDNPAAFVPNPDSACALTATGVLDAFTARVRTAIVIGFVLAGPVLFWQLWRFISPGLTDRERRLSLPFVVSSQVMFTLGIGFAAFVIPKGLSILLGLGGERISPLLTADNYLNFLLTTGLAFGLVFLLPVVLVFLSLLGIVTSASLRRFRPYALVLNVVVAAIVTPTTDALTLFFMAGPMALFYEVSIGFAWFFERRRRKQGHVLARDT